MYARTTRALIVVGAAPGRASFHSVHHVVGNLVIAATALTVAALVVVSFSARRGFARGGTLMGVTG